MPDVKQRMIDIVNSVPDDYFDGLKPTEMVFKLMVEYIKRYGELLLFRVLINILIMKILKKYLKIKI